MGKHSVKNRTPRNAAIVAAVGVVAGVAAPATVSAAPLAQVPSVLNSGAEHLSSIGKAATVASTSSSSQGTSTKAGNATSVGSSVPAQSSSPIGSVGTSTTVGQAIVDAAMSKVGAPYVWGASGPNAFDCSGLTSWAYKQVGKSIPRTSGAQASSGVPVSRADLRPGDIISYYGGASHVAIYIGNNKIVHALNQNSPVRIDTVDYLPLNNIVRF